MQLLFIIGGPGATALAILFLISFLWDRKRGWLIGLILVFVIALIAGQCDEPEKTSVSPEVEETVSEEKYREAVAYFDHAMDSIAALPAYRMAGEVLDSFGFRIRPTMTFMEIDNRPVPGGHLIIRGAAKERDSIDRQFVMEFEGNPPRYRSLKIIDYKRKLIVFHDGD